MSTQTDSTDHVIKLEDAVDHNGRARYEAESTGAVSGDATIAPWLDVPVCPLSTFFSKMEPGVLHFLWNSNFELHCFNSPLRLQNP